jgi:glycosyltransferase involved in cell wall biosynthesis
MRAEPQISIIVPCRNSVRFIGETLRSIQAQTFRSWECVVVDDGSTDATLQVARDAVDGDMRFRFLRQSCGGASRARNRGFMESLPSTPFVVFMDADDVWVSQALEILKRRLEDCPGAIGAHALAELIDENGRLIQPGVFAAFGRRRLGFREGRIREWPLGEPTCFETLVWTGPLHPPGLMLARREAYERAGLFDTRMRFCEDWDLCLRLSRTGKIELVDAVLLHYRRHGGNLSNHVEATRKTVRWLHHKTFHAPENSETQREMLQRGWRAWQLFKLREKWGTACRQLRQFSFRGLGCALRDSPVHVWRFLIGRPVWLRRKVPA